MSSERTSRLIGPVLRWFKPDISQARIKQVQLIVRKGAHVTEYAILCALLWRALDQPQLRNQKRWPWPQAGLAFLLATFYAMTDEFHQSFTRFRFGNFWDVTIDASGAALALCVIWVWGRFRDHW